MTESKTATDPRPERLDLASASMTGERIARLREDFPEVFTEGKVDFDALKRSLGEWVDPGKERFGLNWPGKAACMKTIQQPSVGTLLPVRDESVDFDATQNMIIEGDNLEVLKLLQKSYHGKVKMIYIDPPYNTGNEFIYPDNFTEGLQDYLRYSGQVDGDGLKLSTNTESEGRYHSNWLNMMYPRLFLARNLLRDDGFMIVSIDDHEVHNLRSVLNDVFGEENFIANIIWQRKYTRSNDAKFFSEVHDHVNIYARDRTAASLNLQPRTSEQRAAYSNPDNHPRGPWKATPLHAKSGVNNNEFRFGNGIAWSPPPGTFRRFSDSAMARMELEDEIWFGSSGKSQPSRKSLLSEVKEGVTPITLWLHDEVGHTHEANEEVKKLLGEAVFDNPKPTRLIRRMLELTTERGGEDIVFDFFSGSGTTAHAVVKLNAEDGGDRRFILVQLPEPTEGEYPTISAITRERVRRAGKAIAMERAGKLDLDGAGPLDLGFQAYRLSTSNFKPWDGDPVTFDPAQRQGQLFGSVAEQLQFHADNLLPDRTTGDILAEILLKSGFELTVPVERLDLAGKEVFSVGDGALLVCLERSLTLAVIEAMVARDPGQIICLDAGFNGNDQLKVNAAQAIASRARSKESTIVFKVV